MEEIFVKAPTTIMIAVFYSMPRMLAMFSMIPLFNREALPGLLRIGVAFSFAIFVVPLVLDKSVAFERTSGMMLPIVAKEAFIGFFIGFLIALPLWALDVMGAYVDNQRGASIAATINPLTGHDTSPLGELFSQAGLVLLLLAGGLMMMIEVIYASYVIWPVFELLPNFSAEAPKIFLAQIDMLMWIAVLYSAPVVFAMFLAEVGLAIVSRFVPQLQVFFMAMPIKSAIAMFVFAAYAATLFGYVQEQGENFGVRVIGAVRSSFVGGWQ
jgi:type III secretion protein T